MKEMKDFFKKSLPGKSWMHGIEIKKLPVGKYLDAANSIKNLPEILVKSNFPGMDIDQIFDRFKKIDEQLFFELVGSMIVQIPETALRFISTLIDAPYEKVRNELTPKELLDVLKEFWKVNDMGNFFKDVVKAVKTMPIIQTITNIGSRT